MDHKKVLLCLLTLLLNVTSASINNRVASFTCKRLDHNYRNKQLSLDRYNCDVKIDYDPEELKLSGKCEFNVYNASKWYTSYKFRVHVSFLDQQSKSIFSDFSYPYNIKSSGSERVTFIIPRQDWDGRTKVTRIAPRIEVIKVIPRVKISYLAIFGTFLLFLGYRYGYLKKIYNFVCGYSYLGSFFNKKVNKPTNTLPVNNKGGNLKLPNNNIPPIKIAPGDQPSKKVEYLPGSGYPPIPSDETTKKVKCLLGPNYPISSDQSSKNVEYSLDSNNLLPSAQETKNVEYSSPGYLSSNPVLGDQAAKKVKYSLDSNNLLPIAQETKKVEYSSDSSKPLLKTRILEYIGYEVLISDFAYIQTPGYC